MKLIIGTAVADVDLNTFNDEPMLLDRCNVDVELFVVDVCEI